MTHRIILPVLFSCEPWACLTGMPSLPPSLPPSFDDTQHHPFRPLLRRALGLFDRYALPPSLPSSLPPSLPPSIPPVLFSCGHLGCLIGEGGRDGEEGGKEEGKDDGHSFPLVKVPHIYSLPPSLPPSLQPSHQGHPPPLPPSGNLPPFLPPFLVLTCKKDPRNNRKLPTASSFLCPGLEQNTCTSPSLPTSLPPSLCVDGRAVPSPPSLPPSLPSSLPPSLPLSR